MIGLKRRRVRISSPRLYLRPPTHTDFRPWAELRQESADFLTPWDPVWAPDHLTRRSFINRVYWAQRSVSDDTALPLFLFLREGDTFVGAITVDNIRRGPAQAATIGYWIGASHARQGYMREAIDAVVHHAFAEMGLSRMEAGCLPENTPSRGVLERCGFKYEGVAQSYLQIAGRWRNHVLYANLRSDRRGRSEAG